MHMQVRSRKHISISITERCNLNCIYCFEKSKSLLKMDFKTAIRIIENEMIQSSENQMICFDFMGGEPFLLFDFMKDVCEYIWSKPWARDYIFYTTTNGTLVHGNIQNWLQANQDKFVCCLSLDGHSKAHNINRSNSFDRIDIPFFREMWPDQKVKAIISEKTLPMMYESVVYLHEVGFHEIEAKLAYGFDWSKKEYEAVLISGLGQLVEYYLTHPELVPFTLLNMNILDTADANRPIKKWCGAGERSVSYDMNGDKYPCRYFQDLRKNNKIDLEEIWQTDYNTIQESIAPPCRMCLLKNICRTCYALNYEQNGNFGEKPLNSCRVTRMNAYMTAFLNLEKLKNKYGPNLQGMHEDDKELLIAIQNIQSAYQNNKWLTASPVKFQTKNRGI